MAKLASGAVVANKVFLVLHFIFATILFCYVLFYWNTIYHTDLSNSETLSGAGSSSGIIPKSQFKLCSTLSACYDSTAKVENETLYKRCYEKIYTDCKGSERCCRDCKLLGVKGLSKKIINGEKVDVKIITQEDGESNRISLDDNYNKPVNHLITGFASVVFIHIIGIISSDNRRSQEKKCVRNSCKETFFDKITWIVLFIVIIGQLVLIIYAVSSMLSVVGRNTKIDFKGIFFECRIIFYTYMSLIWVMTSYFLDFICSINFGYKIVSAKKKKATCAFDSIFSSFAGDKRECERMATSNVGIENEMKKMMGDLLDVVKTNKTQEKTKGNGKLISVSGGPQPLGMIFFFKFMSILNGITLFWWILVTVDICSLSNGFCVIPPCEKH